MVIEKQYNHLCAEAGIHFDDNIFFGRPYLRLVAFKSADCGFSDSTIRLSILDDDDSDIWIQYEPDESQFDIILRDLLNWMYDQEKGVNSTAKAYKHELFPRYNCAYKIGH
ncbi:hypothetical protein J6A31_06065 [bacterium]|nr:hypothetical protein [bacterium]